MNKTGYLDTDGYPIRIGQIVLSSLGKVYATIWDDDMGFCLFSTQDYTIEKLNEYVAGELKVVHVVTLIPHGKSN